MYHYLASEATAAGLTLTLGQLSLMIGAIGSFGLGIIGIVLRYVSSSSAAQTQIALHALRIDSLEKGHADMRTTLHSINKSLHSLDLKLSRMIGCVPGIEEITK